MYNEGKNVSQKGCVVFNQINLKMADIEEIIDKIKARKPTPEISSNLPGYGGVEKPAETYQIRYP
jgi:hypothetical protein